MIAFCVCCLSLMISAISIIFIVFSPDHMNTTKFIKFSVVCIIVFAVSYLYLPPRDKLKLNFKNKCNSKQSTLDSTFNFSNEQTMCIDGRSYKIRFYENNSHDNITITVPIYDDQGNHILCSE